MTPCQRRARRLVRARAAAGRRRGGAVISVLLADDQALVRTGFAMILGAEPDLEVAGEAGDGEDAVAQAARLRPDVILMDIRMPRLNGIEATRRLLAADGGEPAPRVLILTTFDQDEYVYEALRAGASGFLLKTVPADQLVAGVRTVAQGEALLAPAITRRLIDNYTAQRAPVPAPPPGYDELTAREREVLALLARGLTNAEIAAELIVEPSTVKSHVAGVLLKLGVRDRVGAVVLAYESGVVRPGVA
jgi:DNA-binding NarL/FixJ family response regulator